jgi:hypothetical protein
MTANKQVASDKFHELVLIDTVQRIGGGLVDSGTSGASKRGAAPLTVTVDRVSSGVDTVEPCSFWLGSIAASHMCSIVDLTVGDVNQDGHFDIVGLVLVPQYGRRIFTVMGPFPRTDTQQVFVSDFSGDIGNLVVNASKVAVMRGAGTMQAGSIVVGAPLYVNSNGERRGRAGVITSEQVGHNVTGSSYVLMTNTVDEILYGASVASCDVDGDGLHDVVIGAPGDYSSNGARDGFVHVFRSGSTTKLVISGDALTEFLGYSLSCADLDGDGKAEVAVASFNHVPGESPTGATRLYTYNSTSTSMVETWVNVRTDIVQLFNDRLTAADGMVIVGSPGYGNGGGRVDIHTSPFPGPIAKSLSAPNNACAFGSSISLSETTLAVGGVDCDTTGARWVYVYRSLVNNDTSPTTTSASGGGADGSATTNTTTGTTLPSGPTTSGNTSGETLAGTDVAGKPPGVAATADEPGSSSISPLVVAGVASTCIVLLGMLLMLYVWRRKKRSAASATASLARHGPVRPSRGSSQARLARTGSRSAVGTRRSRAPTNPQARPHIQAYGETSLAVPETAYAQTSLYPSPMTGQAKQDAQAAHLVPSW